MSLGATFLLFVARFTDVATFAPTLAAMIGLGVGIDYSLFVINRFRQAVHAGHDAKSAAMEAVNTSGRAVVFAASTVIIALLGLFVMRITFFNGLALAASGTVFLVMLSAVWLLPALLSLLGQRAVTPASLLIARGLEKIKLGILAKPFRWSYRLTRHSRWTQEFHPEGGRWAHYGRLHPEAADRPGDPVARARAHPRDPGAVAASRLPRRLGYAAGAASPRSPTTSPPRASARAPTVRSSWPCSCPRSVTSRVSAQIIAALAKTEGVAKTIPNVEMLPLLGAQLKDSTITAIQVNPTTGPQDDEDRRAAQPAARRDAARGDGADRAPRPTSAARPPSSPTSAR